MRLWQKMPLHLRVQRRLTRLRERVFGMPCYREGCAGRLLQHGGNATLSMWHCTDCRAPLWRS